MLNLLAGLTDGYVKGLNSNLEEQQKSDLRKLQIKQFQRELDAKDQMEQAKQGLLAYLTKATVPTAAVQGNQDYNSPGADENTGFDVQSHPAMPGMSFKQAMNTPEALRLALGAGHTFNDIKQFQQPSLIEMLAEYQKRNATGGAAGANGMGGLPQPIVKLNADGTGDLTFDPNKAGELAVQQGGLDVRRAELGLKTPGGGFMPTGQQSNGNVLKGVDTRGMTPTQISELATKRTQEKPQDLANIANTNSNFDRLAQAVRELKNNPELKNATGTRTILGLIPGTEAKGVQADLEAIKSQIGFNVMQTLRDSGKTGSTGLGALNESELKNLQSNLASLDPQQKTEKVKANLQKILDYVEAAKARQVQHYKNTYGEDYPQQVGGKPSLNSFSAPEQTAVNPATGERLVLRGGKWVKP